MVHQVAYDSATGDITPDSQLPAWVFTDKLVVKPDQLIKRRGKAGLLCVTLRCCAQGELLLIFCGVRQFAQQGMDRRKGLDQSESR